MYTLVSRLAALGWLRITKYEKPAPVYKADGLIKGVLKNNTVLTSSMNLKEVYESDFIDRAFVKLQEPVIKTEQAAKQYQLVLGPPEVIATELLQNWMVINYLWGTGFKKDGSLIMGEIGGIMPAMADKGRGWAVAEISLVNKVYQGIYRIQKT